MGLGSKPASSPGAPIPVNPALFSLLLHLLRPAVFKTNFSLIPALLFCFYCSWRSEEAGQDAWNSRLSVQTANMCECWEEFWEECAAARESTFSVWVGAPPRNLDAFPRVSVTLRVRMGSFVHFDKRFSIRLYQTWFLQTVELTSR